MSLSNKLLVLIINYSMNLSNLLLVLIIYTSIFYMFYERKCTMANIVRLITLSLVYFLGKVVYHAVDEFLKNNTWAFLLLLFLLGIYALK
jgi:hypothetical protein